MNEADGDGENYPVWLNRTFVPVPEGDADCVAVERVQHDKPWLNRTFVPVPEGDADYVAVERVQHDKPVFLDLPCVLERPFACDRVVIVRELNTVRCRTGLYRVFDGRMEWSQAASYCLLRDMTSDRERTEHGPMPYGTVPRLRRTDGVEPSGFLLPAERHDVSIHYASSTDGWSGAKRRLTAC
ncbi:ABC transporter, solute-binding protein [Operophtera brumata]|uniref:ABC transporter, solute-binding protein n=1 Tax=Operophtera brumata TaxID=104452 RepID=A0A0L7KYK7_OPEBR|nr:ABC transporter, solute-binding protein [Operophtera brumata]